MRRRPNKWHRIADEKFVTRNGRVAASFDIFIVAGSERAGSNALKFSQGFSRQCIAVCSRTRPYTRVWHRGFHGTLPDT